MLKDIPPDVWATLIAALIGAFAAILGVIIQREIERRDKRAEASRQRREIARAMLLEIDSFYQEYLNPIRRTLSGYQPGAEHTLQLKPPPEALFPVYHSNAYRIGEFERIEIEALVRFYQSAENFAATLAQAVKIQTDLFVATSQVQAQGVARFVFGRMNGAIPAVVGLGVQAAHLLAKKAVTPSEDIPAILRDAPPTHEQQAAHPAGAV